ncbi:MAG: transcription-repair coupling factor [Lachnospiraceae bacterium]|nr:transcription-repair coupling factor [Lachnospiraceae bacterium]
MQYLIAPIMELADMEEAKKLCLTGSGFVQIAGCVRSQKTHMAVALGEDFQYNIIAVSDETKAIQALAELNGIGKKADYYPAKDLLFFRADLRSKDLLKQRMEVFKKLSYGESFYVVTTFESFLEEMPSFNEILSHIIQIEKGQSIDFNDLQDKLSKSGYERTLQIEGKGEFAVRGGILDVFPLTEDYPFRIEFWGEEVDSIRIFQIETQRSIEEVQEVTLFPATDDFEIENSTDMSLLEYFPKEKTFLILDEPSRLLERALEVEAELNNNVSVNDILKKTNSYTGAALQSLESKARGFEIKKSFSIHTQSMTAYHGSFDTLIRDLKAWKRGGYRVVLLSPSETRAKRLAEDLRDYSLSSYYNDDEERLVRPGEIMTAKGFISEGYQYPLIKYAIISESDIFGRSQKKKTRVSKYEGQKINSFRELKPGDYVVHENHGIGIYQGIEKLVTDKIAKDYIKILYAKGSALYIPATGLDVIQKYAGSEAKAPKLSLLGGKEWHHTRTRVKAAARDMAKELMALYAKRQEYPGHAYNEDTIWQKEFEELFPFEETDDQLLAIEDVKRDMESSKIMDRLICGDVGYGKTEVAIRAAFKAVQENKQVAFLVPTTILASQHYHTLSQRLKDYPVQIELLCRFRTPAEQKKSLERLSKGLSDIVVGTHRLLSKDVKFKDLGLLIIDEEQRFGVSHKEKIKSIRETVDVLTLTATPIPRTLHMSLIGIRDMSVLTEAPQDRFPIQTYVMEYDDETAKVAIERELARDGQVYYVYNRVDDIAAIAANVRKLAPNASVAYAHGQMPEAKLERIMYDFINGDIDVLVSTTIVEAGLDIPNVNTMIVHDSDRMGLSQLYQLRGRVGRSNRMAYAFLLYRRDKLLKEVAEKRLAAIREFTDLGSGFRIAMRDLEIRGAGNLLGTAQHGYMEQVGYDLYCKLLNEAVKQLKGELSEETFTTSIDLALNAHFPDSYIEDESLKLEIYKKIAAMETKEEIAEVRDELVDRFGEIPKTAESLLEIALLKIMAHEVYITDIEQKEDRLLFSMYEKAKVAVQRIPDLLNEFKGDLQFKNWKVPTFVYEKRVKKPSDAPIDALEITKKVISSMKMLLEA